MFTRKNLTDTVVSRCGKTARYVNEETRAVRLEVKAERSADGDSSAVRLFFVISSKGGGKTEIYLDIGSADFADVLAAMVEVSRPTALTAMSALVAKQLAEQSTHDAQTSELARKALVDLAKKKVQSATSDHSDAAQLVYKQVVKLANELREAEGSGEG